MTQTNSNSCPPKNSLVKGVQQQLVIEKLQQEIERLKAIQKLDSQASSKPPSTDLLFKPEKPKKPRDKSAGDKNNSSGNNSADAKSDKPKRKPGGQPGHPGKTRSCFGRVDRYSILKPQKCTSCGCVEFEENPASVQRQQVAQLVAHPIEVVEYQRQTCRCACCGQLTAAPWSKEIVPGQDLSVRLQALLVWLGNYGHLSYEKQQELLWELGKIEIGVGTLNATNARMADGVKESVDGLREWIKQQPLVHVDESPWPVLGLKEWLWVSATQECCLFHPGDTRSRAELIQQLGSRFDGVINSDDYSAYNGYEVKAQQKCLAHLLRHFKKVVKLSHGNNPALGQAFIELIEEAFAQHRQWRQTQDSSSFFTWAASFKLRVALTIQQWISTAGYESGKLLRSLRDKAQQWWYFLDHPEVPPDNNLAERSLRLAVTKRKVSGGSRSMERFQQTADLLSVVQTCRRQGRSVIEFFQAALVAQTELDQSLSLLPEPVP
ncbi:MAG: IS66 family transposase [Coleofasciculus sp. F4-SAH-05]